MTKDLNHPTKPIKPFNNDTVMNRLMKFNSNHPKKKSKNPLILSLATVMIVMIMCAGTYVGYKNLLNSNEHLFNKNFECYNINDDRTLDHIQAIKKYNDGDFEEAAKLFDELSKKDSILGSNAFYLAISYIKCKKYYAAIDLFEKIVVEHNVYKNSCNWYLGLCYLKLHKNTKARQQFESLRCYENEYRSKAEKILENMRN